MIYSVGVGGVFHFKTIVQFLSYATSSAKFPSAVCVESSIVLSPPMLIVSSVLSVLFGSVSKIFLIDFSFKIQPVNIPSKFTQFVNPARLGLNSRNPEQPSNIYPTSVRLSGSSTLHEVNPEQSSNIKEVFVRLSGSSTVHSVNLEHF